MQQMRAPWAGLARCAPRVDLWPVLRRLGEHAAAAPRERWVAAGFPIGWISALDEGPWPCAAVTAGSAQWPASLTDLPAGPVALSYEGDLSLLQRPGVALIGARACTTYGRDNAARLAGAVAAAGAVVVSGLARGIDIAAHDAAPGATVAVLGQGLHVAMPAWQARVRGRLLDAGGLVLSEFPPDLPASLYTFPIRNRIVAGLARATVVIEAGHRSGTKNTVAHALGYGREVLALPGPIHADASAGCLDLIEQGAGVVRGPATVLAAAGLTLPVVGPVGDDPEAKVYAALSLVSTPEDIAVRTGLAPRDVTLYLGALEVQGRVVRQAGRRYIARPG